ncbi:isocitrate lyase/PEP mutase family protein [Kaistia adipata]|uniref:isocitrate lyase/PEP mutase family protein n=1 Tax=Kaistia adipata TaxID=166954 RepID=UPI000402EE4E|nr:isocitrate lyase/phosphoenolpyruvate mutase family protein [Kaistia adipata]
MTSIAARRATFRRLHDAGCFVMPNPWDIGSARLSAGLGFPALATTSGGFAFSRGLPDGAVDRDTMLAHVAEIVAATELPVNADFGNAFADAAEAVATNVALCVETGIAGLSVEDMAADRSLYEFDHAVDRVRAARAAIDAAGPDVLLTARSEALLTGHPGGLDEACHRIAAFAEAGADVLFVPGKLDAASISKVIAAAGGKPVNVIALDPAQSIADLAQAGVRRVSLATALARAAYGGFLRLAREVAGTGTLKGLAEAEPGADLNRFFAPFAGGPPS